MLLGSIRMRHLTDLRDEELKERLSGRLQEPVYPDPHPRSGFALYRRAQANSEQPNGVSRRHGGPEKSGTS